MAGGGSSPAGDWGQPDAVTAMIMQSVRLRASAGGQEERAGEGHVKSGLTT